MKYYNYMLSDFKVNFMIYIPLSIILQSCIGSIAAMYILQTSAVDAFPFFQLTLCVIVSMAYNASVLAQLGYKLVFNMLVLSMLINILLIIINL
ncbi:hypothetical protein [uncultured Lacinutrix sp.]|uniref:hypothetical protein n=1 Tax=uncultured Lacinutrix sp. TaxID=574032 RepID=UPI00261A6F54|nr:hypothetical protein [uncultured Lacinutrix sp.]